MASFDISDLDSRLRKLQDRDNISSLEELETRLARLQDKPYVPSKKPSSEADKLIEQIESEIKLENKSKELNDRPNQELRDRLKKLKEERPKKKPAINKPKNLTLRHTKSIITDSLDMQAKIASKALKQVNEKEAKIPLMDFTTKLYDMRDIIANTSGISKEQEPKLLDMIANTLSKIYDEIKKITTPAINTLKKIGSIFTDSIKSLSTKSSDKRREESKAALKELYKSYVDLKGIDEMVKKEFLKNHYNHIDQLQTPQQIFLETVKVTKSIAAAGTTKVQKTQQAINRIGNLRPSNTPNNKSKDRQKFNHL